MNYIRFLFILIVCTLFVSGCTTKPLESNEQEERIPIQVEAIVQATFSQTIELTGRSRSKQDFPILAPTPLTVLEVYAQLGDTVKEGTPLLRFDDTEARRQLEEARNQVIAMEENIKELEQLQRQAQNVQQTMQAESNASVERAQAVLEGAQTGAVTMFDLLQATTQLLLLQNQMQNIPNIDSINPAQLQMQVDQAKVQIRVLEQQVEQLTVKAPFDGVVTLRNIEPKGIAVPNIPIMQLSNLEQIIVDLQVGSTHILQLQTGLKAYVFFDGYASPIEAKIDTLSPGVGPQSTMYQAQIFLNNEHHHLFPGLLATVEVETNYIEKALLVPIQAIFLEGENPYVYVVEDERAVRREISIGNRSKTHYVVLKGLSKGESVITTGRERMTEGRSVYVQK